MRHRLSRLVALAALAALAVAASGCAVIKKENRMLLNAMDERIQPESKTNRIALAVPVTIAATGALVLDAVVTHPAKATVPAAQDVVHFYWEKPKELDTLSRSLLFVPCAVATPPAFALDWVVRCMFPLD